MAYIVTTIVSGVLAKGSLRNPLTKIRRDPRERQLLAEIMQVVRQALFPYGLSVSTKLNFGSPMLPGIRDPRQLTRAVVESARALLPKNS